MINLLHSTYSKILKLPQRYLDYYTNLKLFEVSYHKYYIYKHDTSKHILYFKRFVYFSTYVFSMEHITASIIGILISVRIQVVYLPFSNIRRSHRSYLRLLCSINKLWHDKARIASIDNLGWIAQLRAYWRIELVSLTLRLHLVLLSLIILLLLVIWIRH